MKMHKICIASCEKDSSQSLQCTNMEASGNIVVMYTVICHLNVYISKQLVPTTTKKETYHVFGTKVPNPALSSRWHLLLSGASLARSDARASTFPVGSANFASPWSTDDPEVSWSIMHSVTSNWIREVSTLCFLQWLYSTYWYRR